MSSAREVGGVEASIHEAGNFKTSARAWTRQITRTTTTNHIAIMLIGICGGRGGPDLAN